MSSVVNVKLRKSSDESYNIVIRHGLSKTLARQIRSDGFGKKYCVITDSNTQKIFGKKLLSQFKGLGAEADIVVFNSGEWNKNLGTVSEILEKMQKAKFDRKDCVIALGGGIVGDIAGFAASIYLRGINFVQVPTTLLAMADSSVGGKTGVNLSGGKNSAGTFNQPKKVYICPEFLRTLPENELRNGMAEVVKHAIVFDAKFFAFLEKNLGKIMGLNPKTLEFVIKRNCELKARVVEKDERESNYRRVVNYGHTIGHALEVLGNYRGLSHGEAISIGMVCEAKISHQLGIMKFSEVERIAELLHKIGLPTLLHDIDPHKIIDASAKDKKAVFGKVYYSLPAKIGQMAKKGKEFGIEVKGETALNALECCYDNCACCC